MAPTRKRIRQECTLLVESVTVERFFCMSELKFVPLLLVVLNCLGCGKMPSEEDEKKESDRVVSYDAGAIFLDPENRSSWTVCHGFSFQNPSATSFADLKIARKTCGCTHCTIEQPTVPPGGTTTIKLSCDLPYLRKITREGVIITTGLSEVPEVELYLAADAYPRITMIPYSLPSMNVRAGNSASAQVAFVAYQPENEKREPIELAPVGAGICIEKVQLRSVETRNCVRRTIVDCTIRVTCPTPDDEQFGNGQFSGRVEVRHGKWRLNQEFSWQAEVVVHSSPTQVFLQAGRPESETAVIHLTAREPFAIQTIEAGSPYLECTFSDQKAGRNHDVMVRLKRSEADVQGTKCPLVIYVDHPNQRSVQVPVFILWQ